MNESAMVREKEKQGQQRTSHDHIHVEKRTIWSLQGGEALLSATKTIHIVAAVPEFPCGNITHIEFEYKIIIDGSGYILNVPNMVKGRSRVTFGALWIFM